MKKLKMIGTGLCLCLGLISLASCSNDDNTTTTEEPKTIIDMTEDEEEYKFSSIILDYSNAKTTFYVDDDFTYEGLKVTAVYTKDVDDQVLAQEKEITTYSVDTEYVDMSTVGAYVVTVNGRSGMSQQSATYVIHVVSRESVVSDEVYLAGLDVVVAETSTGYKDSHTVTFTQGDTFVKPVIGSGSRLVYFKGNEISEDDCVTVTSAHLSNVDTTNLSLDSDGKLNQRGSYYIIYSLTIKGVTVKSFVIVEVKNVVSGIEFKNGTVSQTASVKGFDYSDWTFILTRETGDTEEFTYDEDYITIEGVNSLVVGEYTATIKYKDEDLAASKTTTTAVSVTEPDFTIVIETDFSGMGTAVASSEKVQLGTSGYFYFLGGKGGATKETGYEINGLTFTYRGRAGTGSVSANHLEVVMPSAGSIVIYCGTSGSTRYMECCDSDGDVLNQFVMSSSMTSIIIDVEEAGSYYFYSTGSDLYYYGAIITFSK